MSFTARAVALVALVAVGGCGAEDREASPSGVAARQSALTPTVSLTLDLGGYLGAIIIGPVTAASQGAAYPVELPSGQHDIYAPDSADLDTGGLSKLATLTVDAAAGTIALSPSVYFAPVAPGDRTLHLQTIVFPYEPDDTAFFSLGFAGIGWLSGGGGVYDMHVLDNRRYRLFLGNSSALDGKPDLFDAVPDVRVRNGCAELGPEGAGVSLSFSIHNCKLRPDLSVVLLAPGTDVPVGLLGVRTLLPGQPFKVIRNRIYWFTGPNSFDIQTGSSQFSDKPDLVVGVEGAPDTVHFLPGTKGADLFAIRNRMIVANKVTTVPFDPNGSVTQLFITSDRPITATTQLLRGRRYTVLARRSWDPGDVAGQGFIDGRIGLDPGITVTDAGTLEASPQIQQRFTVIASPPRLIAKVGTVKFTLHGITDQLMVDATPLKTSGSHCGTKVLIDRLHQLTLVAPNGDWTGQTTFQFNADGTCAPTRLTFPQGYIDLSCARTTSQPGSIGGGHGDDDDHEGRADGDDDQGQNDDRYRNKGRQGDDDQGQNGNSNRN